jgi:two-component system response regulator YesN
MQKACDLLITTAMPIADICQQLSFSNQTYFFKKFKEYHGMSPAKYRKLNRLQN